MGSTTPVYGLPYPLGTDLITEGDNAIRALAERVEALLAKLPAGWLFYNKAVTNQLGIGVGMVGVAGLKATGLVVPAGRRISITSGVHINVVSGVPQTQYTHVLVDGAEVGWARASLPAVGYTASLFAAAVVTPAAGAHTFEIAAHLSQGTADIASSAIDPAWILIEDIGPAVLSATKPGETPPDVVTPYETERTQP